MSWVVKKASAQSKVTCDEHGVTLMTSKSSFLPKKPERRIRRTIVGVIGPRVHIYIYIYRAGGPIRGH